MKIHAKHNRTVVIMSAYRTERTTAENEAKHQELLKCLEAYTTMYEVGAVSIEECEGMYKGEAERSVMVTMRMDKERMAHLVGTCADLAWCYQQESILRDNGQHVHLIYTPSMYSLDKFERIGDRLEQVPPALALKEDAYTRLKDGSCWVVR